MNIADTIDSARRAFEIAGRGCLVRLGEDEPTEEIDDLVYGLYGLSSNEIELVKKETKPLIPAARPG